MGKRNIAIAIYLVEFLTKLAVCADLGEVGEGLAPPAFSRFEQTLM